MKQTYTVREVAGILGYSTNSIYTFLKEKRIKGVRVGRGRFRIPDAEVQRLLGEKKKPGDSRSAVVSAEGAEVSAAPQAFEAIPVHYRIEVPSLFDWFVGIASIITGLSVFMFSRGYEEFALPGAYAWMPVVAVLLLSGGAGLLLSDITGYGKSVWSRIFRAFLILGFAALSSHAAAGRDPQGIVLYSSLAFTVFLSSVTALPGVVLFSVFTGVLTPVLLYMLAPVSGPLSGWMAFIPVSAALYAVIGLIIYAGIICLVWRSYRGNRFFFWIFVAMTGIVLTGTAVIEAEHLLWGRSFLLALSAVTSLFLPSWDSLIFTKRTDRKLSFSVFSLILAVFILALVSVHLIGGSLLEYTESEMLSKAGYAQVSLDNVFEAARTSLGSSAQNPAVRTELTSKSRSAGVLSGVVRSLYESNPSISQVALLTRDASPAATYPLTSAGHSESYADNPVVLNAFATRKTVTAKTVALTGDRAGLVAIAVPVPGTDGTPVGMFVGGVSLKHIGARLQKLSSPITGEKIWIVTDTGQVLFGRGEPPHVGTGTETPAEGTGEESVNGQRTLIAYRKAESGPWRVVLTMPVTDVFRLAHTATYTILVVTIVPFAMYMVFLFFHRGSVAKTAEDGS